MGITSGIVLFMVIWSMVFFIVLPLRMVSQGDTGSVVPGTHASAPADAQVGRKAKLTTLWAVPLWCVIAGIILSGAISVRDIDWFDRMSPPAVSADQAGDTDG